MSPPALGKHSIRILTVVFNTPAWRCLFKTLRSAVLLLPRLLSRILYRSWVILNYKRSKEPPSQDGTGLAPPNKPSSSPQVGLTYTVIRDGDIIPLHDVSTSVYPFPGGSIRSTSRLADRPGTPSGRLTPSNRSVASLSNPLNSTPHTPANSVPNFPRYEPTDLEMRQIERRDYEPSDSRNPQRKDSEVPGIFVEPESPPAKHFTPHDSAIQEEFHCDSPQSPSLNFDKTFLGVPGSSAASSHTRISTRPSSIADSESSSWEDGWDLGPTFPVECFRYERRTKIMKKPTDMVLQPLEFTLETFTTPDDWTRFAHPEGCCYFYNESKKIYTDAEIYDPVQFELIKEEVERIEKAKNAVDFPPNAEIVFNVYGDTSNPRNRQYFCMDHDQRVIFFFHEFHAAWVPTWGEVEGAFSKNQLRYELEAQYWYAVQMYPHGLTLTKDMVDELRDIVLHLIGDSMTSPYSTAEFTLENLHKILSVTSNVKENIDSKHTSGTVCLLARFMFMFNHSRFLHFHGESYARIERNFSVYGDALYPRTWFHRCLSLLLFSAPDVHLENLQKMWVDKVLHKAVWEETLKKFSTEWQELVTSSAILLNANVAFLAILPVNQSPPVRSWAQIVSYASVVSNIGGMILGLLLIRQHRNIRQETSDHVHAFLRDHDSNFLGLEALAVMFSLPYAFLMWGMVSFLAAFALMCLDRTGADTRIPVGIALGFTGLLIAWCIKIGWEKNEKDTSMEDRTLAYYPPAEEECESDPSQSSNASQVFSKAESLRSNPGSAAKPQPRFATVFIRAFQCIYALGDSRNRGGDATAAV